MKVITRFPPSPTGYLHIGRARTALFNYLFTKQNKGSMVFRIEDTDTERSKKEFEADIIECLAWLGITYDSGPIRQSERNEVYKKYLKGLLDSGHAYISKEAEGDRGEVIRFKNPNKKIVFEDLIRGTIEFDTTDLKDFVIAKSLEEPLYHVAVVVDDHEMGVTHILRGEDGISNTPRQILIQEAIGAARPIYAHIPLILAADRSKLSGRHGAVSVTDYRNKGYVAEAMVNYLALLGWNPGTEQEIFSLQELIGAFDIHKVQKSGAVFNPEKLDWFNRQYIVKQSDADFLAHATSFIPAGIISQDILPRLIPVLRDKISTFGEITRMIGEGGELRFIQALPAYEATQLLWKKTPDAAAAKKHLVESKKLLETASHDIWVSAQSIKDTIWAYADANGKGDVLWPLRFALTGLEKSPDPFIAAFLLGREESVQRIDQAITKLT